MDKFAQFTSSAHIAYFSMEIALQPEVHTYSGGLGMLAGDTARSCADLEMPVVFVTLASRKGYLRQEVDADGNQIEHEDPWDVAAWTEPLGALVAVQIEGRGVWVRPWLYRLKGGTGFEVPVIILDTDVEGNAPEDRALTDRLYGGDIAYRLKQEVVLGVGGLRVLRALGFDITTYHMNEGHAALLAVELLRDHGQPVTQRRPDEFPYDLGRVRQACIFTTHTPVEAGHDRFPYSLVEQVVDGWFDMDHLKLVGGKDELNMTHLALYLSGYVNGVAKRHAETSRKMFPGYTVHAVTNGVHAPTWAAPSFAKLFDEYCPDWRHEPELLAQMREPPDDLVWQAHQKAKGALIGKIQEITGKSFDLEVPILGFARRMTGYKRPDLLFTDIDRLRAIGEKTPFQLVLAGKAHPRDQQGKELIRFVLEHARALEGVVPIVYLPNYEMAVARYLKPGVDVWLNTPLPPMEASGTSGMKAALNGGLNVSVLDGWWYEACVEGRNGWGIGGADGAARLADAAELYDKLGNVVLPLYYNDRPRWIWMMKRAISEVGSYFNSHRMMRRYAAEAYIR